MSKKAIVYVLDCEGKPLMPTSRCCKVRRMLKSGMAKAVCSKPFTIQLTYETKTHIVQDIVLGIDPGRINIGITAVLANGENVYSAKVTTCNDDTPQHMRKRRICRRASRQGERKRRQRRAIKNKTVFNPDTKTKDKTYTLIPEKPDCLGRLLPGCEKVIPLHYIKNTEARFNNRKRSDGWLTPTATQLLRTHVNLVKDVCKFLPVSQVVLEVNKFAFMAIDNPKIQKWQYAKGPLYGYSSVNEVVSEQQEGKCLFCEEEIKNYHHVIPTSRGGSNTLPNIVGLCDVHHDLVHKDAKWVEKVQKKKSGQNKIYGSLSVLNQIIPRLTKELGNLFPGKAFVTDGNSTHRYREEHNLKKDHHIDAYCIACSIFKHQAIVDPPHNPFEINQFRRHDRARIKSQNNRYYYTQEGCEKGKKVKVATNRRKACIADPKKDKEKMQIVDSLEDWYNRMVEEVGKRKANQLRSTLIVTKGKRNYNTMGRPLPGSIFIYQGKRYVLKANHGEYVQAIQTGKKDIPRQNVKFVAQNNGLVYI